MKEVEPDVEGVAKFFHTYLLEFRRYVLPEVRLWERMLHRGPYGGFEVTLADNSQLFISEAWLSPSDALRSFWCSVCGKFCPDYDQASSWLMCLEHEGLRVGKDFVARVCNDCSQERHATTEEHPEWHQEMISRLARLRAEQMMRQWEAEHPRRMPPFR